MIAIDGQDAVSTRETFSGRGGYYEWIGSPPITIPQSENRLLRGAVPPRLRDTFSPAIDLSLSLDSLMHNRKTHKQKYPSDHEWKNSWVSVFELGLRFSYGGFR